MALASGHNSLLSCNGSAALSSEREHFDLPRELLHLREAPHKDNACSNGILPNSVSTPPPQANGRFVAGIFRRKLANSLKQRF